MTAHRPVRRHWLQAETKCYWGLQQLCKSCRTRFKFYCMFYFTCGRSSMSFESLNATESLRRYRRLSTRWTTEPRLWSWWAILDARTARLLTSSLWNRSPRNSRKCLQSESLLLQHIPLLSFSQFRHVRNLNVLGRFLLLCCHSLSAYKSWKEMELSWVACVFVLLQHWLNLKKLGKLDYTRTKSSWAARWCSGWLVGYARCGFSKIEVRFVQNLVSVANSTVKFWEVKVRVWGQSALL